jgi:hypothetical protein
MNQILVGVEATILETEGRQPVFQVLRICGRAKAREVVQPLTARA